MNIREYFCIFIVLFINSVQFTSSMNKKDTIVKLRYSRSTLLPNGDLTKVEFSLDDKNVTLNLRKSPLIGSKTPVWLLKQGYHESIIQETNPLTLGNAVQFYIDESTNTSIAVTTDEDGKNEFMGIYGGHWHIAPLFSFPLHKRKSRHIYQKRKFPMNGSLSDDIFQSDYHRISQISKYHLAANIITLPTKIHENTNRFDWKEQIHKREVRQTSTQSTVYPEILIITDYNIDFVSPTNNEFYNFLMYIIVFWNSVDLRFRELENPKIRLHISGIIVAMNHGSVPFFQNNLEDKNIKANFAKIDMSLWLYDYKNKIPIQSYDIAVAMTNTRLCLSSSDKRCASSRITGIASKIAGTCRSEGIPSSNPTVIINDLLDFSGILRATHEIGHLFGADHDDTKINKDCDDSDHIMAPTDEYNPTRHTWSECSKRSISKFLKTDQAHCLHNKRRFKNPGRPLLKTRSLLDQCNVRGYMYACDPTPNTCSNLYCWSSGLAGFTTLWSCTNVRSPPLDGSPCGIGYCWKQKCIPSKHPISGDFTNASTAKYVN